MEVVADLGERMLRRFPLQVAHFVDAAALHRRAGPHQPDRAPQPGVPVDDAEHGHPEAPRHEIIEAAFPRRERLAVAEVQGEQMFVPVG